jgi:ABC-type transport system involved in cytochrome c biogenesis permease subunit
VKRIAWITAAIATLLTLFAGLRTPTTKGFDVAGFGALPVLHNGRIKPLDTVGRSTMLMLLGKQSVKEGERRLGPSEWLLEVLTHPEVADKTKVFMINDADVLSMLGRRPDEARFYSYDDLFPKIQEIRSQAEKAHKLETPQRDRFQRAIVSLEDRLAVYWRLRNTLQVDDTQDFPGELAAFGAAIIPAVKAMQAKEQGKPFEEKDLEALKPFFQRYEFLSNTSVFHPLPPMKGGGPEAWTNMGGSLMDTLRTGQPHPSMGQFALLSRAWRQQDKAAFAAALGKLQEVAEARVPDSTAKARLEVSFNRIQPFYLGILFYTLAALMYFVSWLKWEGPLKEAAWGLMLFTLILHSLGMFTRMYLEGRPPVTNLYSSAVFIGWFGVLLAIPFERYTRRGFAALGGAVVGAGTLIIAHNLTGGGDTMEMMRAVLDSNFWLATHVTTITIGYSATFLAGLLAHIYILRGVLSRSFQKEEATSLANATYGVVCFALFFSFVGTVLGGIWADQSWGRFWGWDPKENGALMIVLWNATILHARWAGYIRERGLMIMAVGGNIITALSWFGVNMLGIGLHSYGFMDQAFYALAGFTVVQLLVIAVASIPLTRWRSRTAN